MGMNCLLVGLGGAVGAVCRYLLTRLPVKPSSGFPVVTLGINVLGAFALGALLALAGRNVNLDPRLMLFLKVGVCGGFTTFSTFCGETEQLLAAGHTVTAAVYIALSVLLGVGAVWAAQLLFSRGG